MERGFSWEWRALSWELGGFSWELELLSVLLVETVSKARMVMLELALLGGFITGTYVSRRIDKPIIMLALILAKPIINAESVNLTGIFLFLVLTNG